MNTTTRALLTLTVIAVCAMATAGRGAVQDGLVIPSVGFASGGP